MSLVRKLRRFARETKAIAAIEFAILAPMMVFLLFGSVDLIDMLGVNRRVQNVAASLSDVTARDTSVTTAEMNGLWAALDVLMYPDDGDAVGARVTSISIVNATTARVVWSRGHGSMAARNANSNVTLPAPMMIVGTSIIMTETEMSYSAPLGFLLGAPVKLSHTAYRRSRLVDPIPCEWSGCT